MPDVPPLAAVGILLGGSSRRMGEPKHDLQLPDGRTLLDAMVEVVDSLCETIILCGTGTEHASLPCVHDAPGSHGPLAGIEALLRHVGRGRCLVLPCDMPGLCTDDLRRLAEADAPLAIFAGASREKVCSLPMLIDAQLLPILENALAVDRVALHELLSSHPHALVSAPSMSTLVNLNTPAEVEQWFTDQDG